MSPELMTKEALERALGVLAGHTRVYQRVRARALVEAGRGAARKASALAQVAAEYAWLRPVGVLSDAALERAITGRPAAAGGEPRRSGAVRRVLHVMTEAAVLGGHTRLVWRWALSDRARAHSVVLTRSGRGPVPAQLAEAMTRSGGEILSTADAARDLPGQAAALRALALRFDAVAIHAHSYDAVPTLAFAHRAGLPPVILLNHADHVFWLGVTAADVFAHIRDSGVRLSASERGIDAARCAVIPLPLGLDDAAPLPDARAARERLGVPEGAVLFASVAGHYKFAPVTSVTWLDAVLAVLEACPRAVCRVVGVDAKGAWAEAEARTGGRLRALGVRSDLADIRAATDVYIDSYPFASITSLLEAGSAGAALVAFAPQRVLAEILATDQASIEPHLRRAGTVAELVACCAALAGDDAARRKLGAETREAIRRGHSDAAFVAAVERLYALAGEAALSPRPPRDVPPRALGVRDALLFECHKSGGMVATLDRIAKHHTGFVPGAAGWRMRLVTRVMRWTGMRDSAAAARWL